MNEKYGFVKTNEKMEVTFNGWDGKSYDGESKKMAIWTNSKHPGKKFVNKKKGGFQRWDGTRYSIDAFFEVTDNMVINKLTGEAHPEVEYFWSAE